MSPRTVPPAASARLTRSQLLRRVGAAAAAATVYGAAPGYAFAGPMRHAGRALAGRLSIVQWNHPVAAYDAWFDAWASRWGEAHDVEVEVDHVDYTRLPALAAAEAKNRRGHDVFGFLAPPSAFEEHVIDHTAIVGEVERLVGPYGELARRSTYNPRTRRYFGVSDGYVPAATIWRHDLWNSVGESPATWDHVATAAPRLAALGAPIGIGQSREPDSNVALLSLMASFGARLQDESNAPALASKQTVEAVRFVADLYRSAPDPRVFGWSPVSNNQLLLGGRGSMIVNAVSAVRTADALHLPFAKDVWVWPIPRGPAGRSGLAQHTSVYAVWQFARNREAAQQFLVDLCAGYEEATLASRLFNYPSFPGAFPSDRLYAAAAADQRPQRGTYSILTTVATKLSRNAGHPGTANAAVDEVLSSYLIPRMFAQASQGRMSPEDAVRSAAWETKRIWRKWRAAGRV